MDDRILNLIIGALLVLISTLLALGANIVLNWIRRKAETKKLKNKICNEICDCIYLISRVTDLFLTDILEFEYHIQMYKISSDIIDKDLAIERFRYFEKKIGEFNSLNKSFYSLINDYYFYFEQNDSLEMLVQGTKKLIFSYPYEPYIGLEKSVLNSQHYKNRENLASHVQDYLSIYKGIDEFIREKQKELRETKWYHFYRSK